MTDLARRLGRAVAEVEGPAAADEAVRDATDGDAVGGVRPSLVVRPATVAGVAAALRTATDGGLSVVARGGGSAIDWGAPPERLDVVLELGRLDRVVEHQPGDLVVVSQAGARVSDVQQVVGEHGQRLAMELPRQRVQAGGTIGGAIATATVAPRRLRLGAVRDHLLGATVVLSDGTVASTGGKVVKNVAGYDLAKLVTGAHGTLAVVVQAAWRLLSEPAERAFVVVEGAVEVVCARARDALLSPQAPDAVELDRRPERPGARLVVLVEGSRPGVRARAQQLALGLGGAVALEAPPWWGRLPGADDDVLLKATATVPGVAGVMAAAVAAEQTIGVPVTVRGSATGVLHLGLPRRTTAAELVSVLERLRGPSPSPGDGAVTVLRGAPEVVRHVDQWGPVAGLDLMQRIKHRLDPARALAPGRFVGGI
ncbi:MAG: FAD-binding oxidoreductase [Angustibacter sp.]